MSEWKKPWVYNPREAEERILQLEERNRQLLEENTDLKILLFRAYHKWKCTEDCRNCICCITMDDQGNEQHVNVASKTRYKEI